MSFRDFLITGRFQDLISGPMAGVIRNMSAMTAAAQRMSRTIAAGGNPTRNQVAGMNALARATNAAARAHNALYGIQNRQNRTSRGLGGSGAGYAMLSARGAAAFGASRLGMPGVAALGLGFAGFKGVQQFAAFEKELVNVAKAANMSRNEMFAFGGEVQKLAQKYGIGQEDTAQMASRIALGGLKGDRAILGVTEAAAMSQLLFQDVDPEMVGTTLAKTASKFYKGKSGEELAGLMKQFVGTVDYFEDNFPTDAANILKGYYRFMSAGEVAGLTPEQIVAQVATMTSLGEPSGERGGSRLKTNYNRIGGIINETIKKGKLDLKGIDLKGLQADLLDNSQVGIYKFLDALINRGTERGLKKGLDPAKAAEFGKQNAMGVITQALGNETAGNLAPLISDYWEAVLQASVTNKKLAEWAINQPGFKEFIKTLGDDGEKIVKELEAFTKTPSSVTTIAGGQMGTNIKKMMETVDFKMGQTKAAFERFMTAIGADLQDEAKSVMDRMIEGFNARSSEIEAQGLPILREISERAKRGEDVVGEWLTTPKQMDARRRNSFLTPYAVGGKLSSPSYATDGGSGVGVGGTIHQSADRSQAWVPSDGETQSQIDKVFPTNQPGFMERFFALAGSYYGSGDRGGTPLTGRGFTAGGPTMPGGGSLTVPMPTPDVNVLPLPPITIPLTASVSGGGNVQVDVRVTQQPSVVINPGAGAASGSQGGVEAPDGTVQ